MRTKERASILHLTFLSSSNFQWQAPELQCYSVLERAVLDEGSAQFSFQEAWVLVFPGLLGEEGGTAVMAGLNNV